MKKEFSVLMSVYENENPGFLGQAINSVINQTRTPKEIILVEDGPLSDELYYEIESLTQLSSLIKRVKLPEHVGLGQALAIGVHYVTTNYIARMDSDDISLRDRFEKQMILFDENESLALVGGQIAEFRYDISDVISYRTVPSSDHDIRRFAKYRSPFNHPTVIMRKDVLKRIGGYQSFPGLEDYHLWVRFLMQNDFFVYNLDDTVLFMRVGSDLYNRRGGMKYFQQYVVLRKKFRSWGFINFPEYVISITLMAVSTLAPNWLRKYLYIYILRK